MSRIFRMSSPLSSRFAPSASVSSPSRTSSTQSTHRFDALHLIRLLLLALCLTSAVLSAQAATVLQSSLTAGVAVSGDLARYDTHLFNFTVSAGDWGTGTSATDLSICAGVGSPVYAQDLLLQLVSPSGITQTAQGDYKSPNVGLLVTNRSMYTGPSVEYGTWTVSITAPNGPSSYVLTATLIPRITLLASSPVVVPLPPFLNGTWEFEWNQYFDYYTTSAATTSTINSFAVAVSLANATVDALAYSRYIAPLLYVSKNVDTPIGTPIAPWSSTQSALPYQLLAITDECVPSYTGDGQYAGVSQATCRYSILAYAQNAVSIAPTVSVTRLSPSMITLITSSSPYTGTVATDQLALYSFTLPAALSSTAALTIFLTSQTAGSNVDMWVSTQTQYPNSDQYTWSGTADTGAATATTNVNTITILANDTFFASSGSSSAATYYITVFGQRGGAYQLQVTSPQTGLQPTTGANSTSSCSNSDSGVPRSHLILAAVLSPVLSVACCLLALLVFVFSRDGRNGFKEQPRSLSNSQKAMEIDGPSHVELHSVAEVSSRLPQHDVDATEPQ